MTWILSVMVRHENERDVGCTGGSLVCKIAIASSKINSHVKKWPVIPLLS